MQCVFLMIYHLSCAVSHYHSPIVFKAAHEAATPNIIPHPPTTFLLFPLIIVGSVAVFIIVILNKQRVF